MLLVICVNIIWGFLMHHFWTSPQLHGLIWCMLGSYIILCNDQTERMHCFVSFLFHIVHKLIIRHNATLLLSSIPGVSAYSKVLVCAETLTTCSLVTHRYPTFPTHILYQSILYTMLLCYIPQFLVFPHIPRS